eukprot:s1331_g29.t1
MLRKLQFWDASVRPTARVESLTVLLAACSLLCCERYIAESLFRHTRSVGWQTPSSSEALQAKKQIDEAFPRRIAGTILMAVEAPRNGTVLCRDVEDFVANVSSKVTSDARVQQYKPHVLSYWTALGDIPPSVMSRKDFISADERMTLLFIQPTKIPENHDFAKANDFLQDFCSSPPPGFNLHITGAPALLTGSGCSSNSHAVVNPRDMSFKCLFFAEVITTPIALLIMGCIVRHWRLLILPLFTVCLSFAVSALMLIPWMDHIEVPRDAIAAMGSVILALSLDYSLFLLSRFSENHHDQFTLQENVDIIKACTCRTIAVSGLLVAIAFFAGILLPERNLQGTCISLGFAVLACVATNVVFLPAVFLAFGPVFIGHSFLPSWWGDVQLDDGGLEEDERGRQSEPKSADNTNWLLIMRVVERAPMAAILLVLLFVWPVLSAAPSLHITADRFAMMPLYSPAVLALRKIQDAKLPTGLVNPYEILVTAPEQPRDVLSAELSKGLDSLGLAASHHLGVGELQKALKEGQNSLARRKGAEASAPEDLSGYEELLNGLACANRTASSPQNPHCSCCPNAFLECEECDLAATCASPEIQALLEAGKEGNLTLDDSHLRTLKVCIERAGAMAADQSKNLGDQLLLTLRKVNQSAVQKGLLQRYPFLVDIVSQVQNLSRKERGMLLLPSGFHALLELSDKLHATGGVASILGPQWILHQRLEWPLVVALAAKPELRHGYSALLEQFVNGKQALLQVHTHFPPIGALSADWAEEARGRPGGFPSPSPIFSPILNGGTMPSDNSGDDESSSDDLAAVENEGDEGKTGPGTPYCRRVGRPVGQELDQALDLMIEKAVPVKQELEKAVDLMVEKAVAQYEGIQHPDPLAEAKSLISRRLSLTTQASLEANKRRRIGEDDAAETSIPLRAPSDGADNSGIFGSQQETQNWRR